MDRILSNCEQNIIMRPKFAPYFFMLPFIFSFLVFFVYPAANTVIMSFHTIVPGEYSFVGLMNYKKLFNAHFFRALKNNVIYTVTTLLILIPFPILLAIILNVFKNGTSKIFRAAIFIPSLVSVVVAGILFQLMFADYDKAFINTLLIRLGMRPQRWLRGNPLNAMIVMVVIGSWRWLGVDLVYFMAGLQTIPEELYEVAEIDGANVLQKTFSITLPLLRPTIYYVFIIIILGGFSMFEESFILWQGYSPGDNGLTIMGYLYSQGFFKADMGFGSAIGVGLLIIILAISIICISFFGMLKKEHD